MSLDDILKNVRGVASGAYNAFKSGQTPAQYIVPNVVNPIANSIQGTISPLPQTPIQAGREIASQTFRDIGNSIPNLGSSVLRASPIGQAYEYSKIIPTLNLTNPTSQSNLRKIESYQPKLQSQQAGDLYNSLSAASYASGLGGLKPFLQSVGTRTLGGVAGVGFNALGNILNKRDPFSGAAKSFSEGVQSIGPTDLISRGVGAAIPALNVAARVNPLIKSGERTNIIETLIPSAQRILAKGARETIEGGIGGAIRPLQEGQSRQDAILQDAAIGGITGALTQTGSEAWKQSVGRARMALSRYRVPQGETDKMIRQFIGNEVKRLRTQQFEANPSEQFFYKEIRRAFNLPEDGNYLPSIGMTARAKTGGKSMSEVFTPSVEGEIKPVTNKNQQIPTELPLQGKKKNISSFLPSSVEQPLVGKASQEGQLPLIQENKPIVPSESIIPPDVERILERIDSGEFVGKSAYKKAMDWQDAQARLKYNKETNSFKSETTQSQQPQPGEILPSGKVATGPQQLNVNNLDITKKQKVAMAQRQANITVQKLSNKEVIKFAKTAGIDLTSKTIEQTKKTRAEQLNLRKAISGLENEIKTLKKAGASPDIIAQKIAKIDSYSAISTSQGTDLARGLQARSILAKQFDTPMQKIFKLLRTAGVDPKVYTKEAVNVNFDNADEAVNFYRKLVPPKFMDWIDKIRYNSMLSSPTTHSSNIFSNLTGSSIVAPIEKSITGAIDFLGSTATGRKQTSFVGEAPAYVGGYVSKIGDAAKKFIDYMRGSSQSENLDMNALPLGSKGIKGAIANTIEFPMKLLEAQDQFFQTLTEGGELASLKYKQGKGVNIPDIEKTALNKAKERLFRAELNDPKQGALLKGIDKMTQMLTNVRNDSTWVGKVAKFTIPFIKTPMNILKQMIEYSPAGIATIPGASNKTEQLAKTIMGTSAALGASMLLGSGRLTWAEPTDAKKKAAFRAAGMQPYSVKIGDNWVNYSKLPPVVAANLALVSAIDDSIQNKRLSQSDADTLLSGVAKWGNFFADQSYLKNIGDLLAAVKGDPEKIASYFSNYPQQLIPFRALSGWVARVIDPYQRKVNTDAGFLDKQMQQLMMNIPGASQLVPARLDQSGNPIENQHRLLNAFSQVKVTTEKPEQKKQFDYLMQQSRETRLIEDLKNQSEKSGSASKGDIYAYTLPTGETKSLNLGKVLSLPEITPYEKEVKKAEKFKIADDILLMPADKQKEAFLKIGISEDEAKYYGIASSTANQKYAYIKEKIKKAGDIIPFLITVNSKKIASDDIIDKLYEDNIISKNEKLYIKSLKWDEASQSFKTDRDYKASSGSKSIFSLVSAQNKMSQELAKPSQVKLPSRVKTLDTILRSRSPETKGLESVLSLYKKDQEKVRHLKTK